MKSRPISEKSLMRRLGVFRHVGNMESRNGYGEAPNQFLLTFSNGELFQSYRSYVAAYIKGTLYINEYYHDCSKTTMLYCKRFTGLTASERRKGIQEGKIKTFR